MIRIQTYPPVVWSFQNVAVWARRWDNGFLKSQTDNGDTARRHASIATLADFRPEFATGARLRLSQNELIWMG